MPIGAPPWTASGSSLSGGRNLIAKHNNLSLAKMYDRMCMYIYIYDYRHIIPPKHVEKQLITILVGFYCSFRGGICVHCSIPVYVYIYIINVACETWLWQLVEGSSSSHVIRFVLVLYRSCLGRWSRHSSGMGGSTNSIERGKSPPFFITNQIVIQF